MSVAPSCDLFLTKAADEGNLSVNYLRWCFFVMSILYLSSNVFYIAGIIVWVRSALELHTMACIVWAVFAFLLACQEMATLGSTAASGGPVCLNISDMLILLVYFVSNLYFAVVISSYVEEQQYKF